jgi:hypothetical protein
MERMHGLDELRDDGKLRWAGDANGWIAEPEDVVGALRREGFDEYKSEVTRSRRDRGPTGGIWQGLDSRTGVVASAIWINAPTAQQSIVFIDIDGEPVRGG